MLFTLGMTLMYNGRFVRATNLLEGCENWYTGRDEKVAAVVADWLGRALMQ